MSQPAPPQSPGQIGTPAALPSHQPVDPSWRTVLNYFPCDPTLWPLRVRTSPSPLATCQERPVCREWEKQTSACASFVSFVRKLQKFVNTGSLDKPPSACSSVSPHVSFDFVTGLFPSSGNCYYQDGPLLKLTSANETAQLSSSFHPSSTSDGT